MYDIKEPVLDYLEMINKEKTVLEYGLFQPGLLTDYLAHPCPPSKHFSTFPLLFDLGSGQAIIVQEGTAPTVFTAAADVAKVVARAIDYPEPWTLDGGIVGERTNYAKIIDTAEKITGKEFVIHRLDAADLEDGKFKSSWIPSYADDLGPEQVQTQLIPFLSGWALGVHRGVANIDPVWNKRFPDIKFTTVEEMLRGAWERIKAMDEAVDCK